MKPTASKQEELERLGRALRTLSGSNRALLRATDELALLREICRVVIEEAGYRVAMVVRAEHDEAKSITVLARHTAVEIQAPVPQLTWGGGERGASGTGTAIRTAQPCLISDTSDEAVMPPYWREVSRQQGMRSLLALPLHVDGEVFGALTIGAPEVDAFETQERAVLEETAADLAFGLEMLRSRQRREHAEALSLIHI